MNVLSRALRRLRPHRAARIRNETGSPGDAARTLRADLHAARTTLAELATQLDALQVQLAQLAALRQAELHAPAAMDRLQRILDAGRVAAHVRNAVARMEIVDRPVPHGVVSQLFPEDVYEAVLDAIPEPIFFEGGGGQELRLPPKLAPTVSLAVWTWVGELARDVLVPAIVERFRVPLALAVGAASPARQDDTSPSFTAGSGRLVRRLPGREPPRRRAGEPDLMTIVIDLARPSDRGVYGSRLRGGAAELPFRANSALVVLDRSGAHEYVPIPDTTREERHTCELCVSVSPQPRG